MKKFLVFTLVFSIMLLLIPSIPMLFEKKPQSTEDNESVQIASFDVLDVSTGQVTSIEAKDYVIGAVLAEMPSSYHEEALKAQAVAAFTYALRQKDNEDISPTAELCGADFSNDSTKYQAYFSEDEAKAHFGNLYSESSEKVASAVNSVFGQYLSYEDEPIAAAYHSISSGITESAETVWGESVSYLKPEISEYDADSPDYEHTENFTSDMLKEKLLQYNPEILLSDNPADWINICETSYSGTVTSITVGSTVMTGTQFRSALGLRSACFTVSFSDDSFAITTKGYGHGVGLSQYGANAMAYNGYTYDAILKHYYSGVELKDLTKQ